MDDVDDEVEKYDTTKHTKKNTHGSHKYANVTQHVYAWRVESGLRLLSSYIFHQSSTRACWLRGLDLGRARMAATQITDLSLLNTTFHYFYSPERNHHQPIAHYYLHKFWDCLRTEPRRIRKECQQRKK